MASEQAPEWVIEFFYFGNANYPSDATYRRCGDRLQRQIELWVPVTQVLLGNGSIPDLYTWDGLVPNFDVLRDCEDVRVSVHPERMIDKTMQAPGVYLFGWRELNTKEERAEYERDKRDAWTRS